MVSSTRNYGESTQVVEIIVTGLMNAGKTTFIRAISDTTQWDGTRSENWLSGRLAVDESLTVSFLEPPDMHLFDFIAMRELITSADATAYIVLIDSTDPDKFGEALSILQTIRVYHPDTPVIVAANKQDIPAAWSADDIRIGLGIPDEIPVIPCASTNSSMVKDAVLRLVYLIFGE